MAAESLDDGEFWLPPKFLTDNDDVFVERTKTKAPCGLKDDTKDMFGFDASIFPLEFPYGFESFSGGGVGLAGSGGFSSDLSSPIESNTESESSDGEDYIAGLTRQMAHSTLEDIDFVPNGGSFAAENPKARTVSGSPQSTLCSVGSVCGCGGQGSSHGSPNGITSGGVSSPPATWDLLFAAAGEVAKMRRDDDELFGAFNSNDRVVAPPPRKQSPVTVPLKTIPDVGLYNQQQQYQSLSYQKMQASHFHLMRQQQMIKQHQQQNSVVWGQSQVAAGLNSNRGRSPNNTRAPLGLSSSAWPSLQAAANPPPPPQQQQQAQGGSGMRAVFLGNTGTKKESVGTGVFLPRQIGTPTESRKPVSTVLLPARVVQALNLNVADMRAQPQLQPRFNGAFVPDSAAAASRSRKSNVSQQKHNLRQHQQGMNVELRLPQEWTY